jgi:predicted DNA-binding ribbon-helix-helix protein
MAKSRHKRSITIAGHRTSISVEDAFWQALVGLAADDGRSVAGLIKEIDQGRGGAGSGGSGPDMSLSAAIRLYVLERTRKAR